MARKKGKERKKRENSPWLLCKEQIGGGQEEWGGPDRFFCFPAELLGASYLSSESFDFFICDMGTSI